MVLVHGFTQGAGAWRRAAAGLASDHEVVMVELPNHGRSTDTTAANLGEAAQLVTEACGHGCYVGYSLGGRICLQGALDHPHAVESLVLVSTTAGIVDEDERLTRRRADHALADRLDPPSGGEPELGLEEFLAEWLAGPLFTGLDREQADIATRLENTSRGLATSLRTLGTGSMAPLWDRVAQIEVPAAVVAGGHDEKFLAIGRRLAGAIGPNATLQVVEGVGHAVPFEAPAEFVAIMRGFLELTQPARP